VHLGSVHNRTRPARPKWPSYLAIRPNQGDRGGKFPAPDTGGSPVKFGRPTVIGRRGNSLGVASGDGGSDLRQKAAEGSPWWLLDGGGRSARGDRRGGGGRRSLAVGCWGGKAFGIRAVQTWSEEDRCGLASRRLLAAASRKSLKGLINSCPTI
jgi:hypothetical protein